MVKMGNVYSRRCSWGRFTYNYTFCAINVKLWHIGGFLLSSLQNSSRTSTYCYNDFVAKMNSRILLLTISLGLCVSNVNAGVGKCHSGDCAVVMPPAPRQAPNITTTPAAVPTPGTISPDGTCGGTKKYQCKGSTFGECCSASGFCGSTTGHCQAGCQITFGNCTNPPLSLDGTCGGTNKYQCKGSGFGDCCSSSGYCGSTNAHCTAGCQVSFGSCNSTDISPDGTCGGPQKYKCQDSAFGNCCSSGGYCGSSVNHCAQGWLVTCAVVRKEYFADTAIAKHLFPAHVSHPTFLVWTGRVVRRKASLVLADPSTGSAVLVTASVALQTDIAIQDGTLFPSNIQNISANSGAARRITVHANDGGNCSSIPT
jgi:hypothetical protein